MGQNYKFRNMFQYLAMAMLVFLTKQTKCLPRGSPGCDYSPHHGAPPQDQEEHPHNVLCSKMRVQGWVAVNLTDTEGSLRGFSVKTRHKGQFASTDGVKIMKCEDGLSKSVTHENNKDKKNVMIWFWPGLDSLAVNSNDDEAAPKFEIILVKDYNTFWIDVNC